MGNLCLRKIGPEYGAEIAHGKITGLANTTAVASSCEHSAVTTLDRARPQLRSVAGDAAVADKAAMEAGRGLPVELDVQTAPARSAQRPAFTQTPQTAQQCVVEAIVYVERLVAGGSFDRAVHAGAGSVVAAIGAWADRVAMRPVQRSQDVFPGRCMSWTELGSTSETHDGNSFGADTARMSPPCSWAFPAYHRPMGSPLTLMVFSP